MLVIRHFPDIASRVFLAGIGVNSAAIRSAAPFEIDRPVVLITGRLDAYKRIDVAVRAFALSNSDAELVVIGEGPERNHIEQLVKELNIADRTRILGYVSETDIRRWQRTAYAALSLSVAEAFGLSVAEASIAGARIVASDIPAHRNVAQFDHESFAFVGARASPEEVANALHNAMGAPRRAVHNSDMPTWKDVGKRMLDFYVKASACSNSLG